LLEISYALQNCQEVATKLQKASHLPCVRLTYTLSYAPDRTLLQTVMY